MERLAVALPPCGWELLHPIVTSSVETKQQRASSFQLRLVTGSAPYTM